ncbi:hypothetical protein GCM10025864_01990 [Luteimicrobium album]|uniref:Uncharacterized protein n=1 Tax=Luteimicrobium album TaxID=1054550 RepID=A0ABQ6HXZ0_9MICO|nr:hypothetical protein GCM10025864_01990 [Luteimicrobium album]
MGAAGLDHAGPRVALGLEDLGEVGERGDEVADDAGGRGDVHGRREDVVGRLGRVDVVVRVDAAAQAAGGEGREDLVGVHVRRRAGAGLVDVDGEVAVVRTGRHGVGGRDDGVRDVLVEDAELGVGAGGGLLDAGERLDVRALEGRAGDGEVLDGALRLGPVQGGRGDPHLAHGVVLDAVLGGTRAVALDCGR